MEYKINASWWFQPWKIIKFVNELSIKIENKERCINETCNQLTLVRSRKDNLAREFQEAYIKFTKLQENYNKVASALAEYTDYGMEPITRHYGMDIKYIKADNTSVELVETMEANSADSGSN